MEEGEAAQISTLGNSVVLLTHILPQMQKTAKAESDSESWCLAPFETTLLFPTQPGRFQCSCEDRPNTKSSLRCLPVCAPFNKESHLSPTSTGVPGSPRA